MPASTPAPSSPTTDLSPTDLSTITAALTVLAAMLTSVFHRDVSAYVPVATIVVAGIVTAAVLVAKHRYAAAVAQIAGAGGAVAGTIQSTGLSVSAAVPQDLEEAVKVIVAARTQLEALAAAGMAPAAPPAP